MKSSITVVTFVVLARMIGAMPMLSAFEPESPTASDRSPTIHHVQRRGSGLDFQFDYPIIQVPYFSTGLYGLSGYRDKRVEFDTAAHSTLTIDDWTPPAWWRPQAWD